VTRRWVWVGDVRPRRAGGAHHSARPVRMANTEVSIICATLIAGLAFAFYCATNSQRKNGMVQRRRAAFDIGSGASKMLVADVDIVRGTLVGPPVFEIEQPMGFKADAQASGDGSISKGIQARGLELLVSLAAKARELGATEASGIATEVFRTAPNGLAFLDEVARRTRVSIATLSQEKEARLGLATAEALSGGASAVSASWDSGGGSFQITSRVDGAAKLAPISSASLRTYVGKLGTGPSFERCLVHVQGKPYHSFETGSTVNPVSADEATRLVEQLRSELAPPPAWLRGASVTAIGGKISIFAIALNALRVLRGRREECATLSLADAWQALDSVVGRTDDELLDVAGRGTEFEPPSLVVPKIALLVAVSSHLEFANITFVKATGGCAGLMALGEPRFEEL
jgi:hypothetical protein